MRTMGHHPIASLVLLCGLVLYLWPQKGGDLKAPEGTPFKSIVPSAGPTTSSLIPTDVMTAEPKPQPGEQSLQALIDKMQYAASCYQGHPCFQGEVLTPQQQRSRVTSQVLDLSKQIKRMVPSQSSQQLEALELWLQQQILTAEEVLVFSAVDILSAMPTDAMYLKHAFSALDSSNSELVCLKVMQVLKLYVEAGHAGTVFESLKFFLQNHRFDTDDSSRARLNVLVHMHVLMKRDTTLWFEDVRSLYPENSNEYRILSNHLSRYQ